MTALPHRESDACCDGPATPGKLIPVNLALTRGLALAETVSETEVLPLAAAMGRVLAAPACTGLPLPPFDNSAMDGYGIRLGDLDGDGPWVLPVTGRIAAGDSGAIDLPAGGALRILTGAPVPAAIDAVIMQEHVSRDRDHITIATRPRAGLNIRRRGEDLQAGAQILPAGVEIGAREAGALAAIGMGEVAVRRRLRVTLFCTGSELRHPGEALAPGQIWNANRFMLLAALNKPWIEVTDLGTIPDNPAALTAALTGAADTADMVISTGGISVGDEDHMPRIFRAAGGDIHAMRVAMKPGKPIAIGKIGTAIYVGLPGNPVSAFVTWHVIGAQILGKQAGTATSGFTRATARLGKALSRTPGRCEYRPARIIGQDASGTAIVELMSPSYSARLALLSAADGLAVIPAEAADIAAETGLEFLRFAS